MKIYQKLFYHANGANPHSLANKFRKNRMHFFETFFEQSFAEQLQRGDIINIIDIGGTYSFWKTVGFKYLSSCKITLLNLHEIDIPSESNVFTSLAGNALDLKDIEPKSFDLVFSNSCIEHVGKKPEWILMKDEMMRVGHYYFLQTPNKYFPLEPHFLIPFFQFLPLTLKAFILKTFRVSWFGNIKTYAQAREAADSIHLLSYNDLHELFPNGIIKKEKIFHLTKSYIVMGKAESI